jgi:hypothetical protein
MVLSLDISSKTGFAILNDSAEIVTRGTFYVQDPGVDIAGPQEYRYIWQSQTLGRFVVNIAHEFNVSTIVIEQTNRGKNRTTQKHLEFLHYGVLYALAMEGMNDKIVYVNTSEWRSGLEIRYSTEQRKHNKLVKAKKARGKLTMKHLAVQFVNAKYGLKLLQKDNDQADAICMALYVLKKKANPTPCVNLDEALT